MIILKEKNWLSPFSANLQLARNYRFEKFWRNIVAPDMYGIGPMAIDFLSIKRGVDIKDIITNPEEYLEEVENNFFQILSPLSRRSYDCWQKIFDYMENKLGI